MCQKCDQPLSKEAKAQVELYKALNWGLLYGRAGEGKNYAAASKVRENLSRMRRGEALQCRHINGGYIVGYLKDESSVKVPKKVCNYRKPKVYWFGEAGNNVPYSVGTGASHWAVVQSMKLHYKLEDYFAEYKDESLEISNSYKDSFYKALGDDIESFKGKRFIGISEPEASNKLAEDFMKKITGDVWTETRTLDASSKKWVPQGEIIVTSGKPLKINEKSKEALEQVERIKYRVV